MICSPEDVAPLTITFEYLTPDDAQALLDGTKTFKNRVIRTSERIRYARMMRDGDWMDFTSMIVIDSSGNVIDGQHRLLAQTDSGETVGYVINRGLPTSAYQVIDSGIRRKTNDRSEMNSSQATMAGVFAQYEKGASIRKCLTSASSGRHCYCTEMEVIRYGEEHLEMLRSAHNLYARVRSNIGVLSTMAFALYLCVGSEKLGADETEMFATELSKWDTDCKQAQAAQKSLQARVNGKPKDKLSQLAIMVNALTQYHKGVVPKMATKATYTDATLESWRKKVETGNAQD